MRLVLSKFLNYIRILLRAGLFLMVINWNIIQYYRFNVKNLKIIYWIGIYPVLRYKLYYIVKFAYIWYTIFKSMMH